MSRVELPHGFLAGHWSDTDGWTGCTVLLAPEGSVASGEAVGGGPGSRETDLLSPRTSTPGPEAILLTGGSAFGLAAADGVAAWISEHGGGYVTPAARVPLVTAAVVYDLMLGDAGARPDRDSGYAACEAALPSIERGSVGVGTGCTVGKLLGPEGWTKGGFGAASMEVGGAMVAAVAAVNPIGDVIDADGSVAAGAWRQDGYERAADILRAGEVMPRFAERENTTLVSVLTDARITKLEALLVSRAAAAGLARAVSPCATAFDGDMVFCMASGRVEVDLLRLSAVAAELTSAAIRDAVRTATGAPGCPAASERA